MRMPRIALVMSTSRPGGAERVMTTIGNYWADRGWPVNLFTLDSATKALFYPLRPGVEHHALDLSQPLGNPLAGIFRMRARIQILRAQIQATKPDAVISFNDLTNVITLLAMRGSGIPVIVSERSVPQQHAMKAPWRYLRPWTYRQADCVVCQTQYALNYFSPSIRSRGKIIANPVVPPDERQRPETRPDTDGKVILAMGRLAKEKGFDCLISAFSRIGTQHPNWRLEIWGEGNERPNLEKLIGDLELGNRVRLPGLTKAPGKQMYMADLFVMSSRYEGFPNVLCEAMARGLPVISFDCPGGPAEIIRKGIDGILVPPGNADALGQAMDRLMIDEAERTRLAQRAPDVIERFSMERVGEQWTGLVRELCHLSTT